MLWCDPQDVATTAVCWAVVQGEAGNILSAYSWLQVGLVQQPVLQQLVADLTVQCGCAGVAVATACGTEQRLLEEPSCCWPSTVAVGKLTKSPELRKVARVGTVDVSRNTGVVCRVEAPISSAVLCRGGGVTTEQQAWSQQAELAAAVTSTKQGVDLQFGSCRVMPSQVSGCVGVLAVQDNSWTSTN